MLGELDMFDVKAWWRKTSSIFSSTPPPRFWQIPPVLYTTKSLLCSPVFFKCCFRRPPPSDCSTAFHDAWRGGWGANQLRVKTMAHFQLGRVKVIYLELNFPFADNFFLNFTDQIFENMGFWGVPQKKVFFFTFAKCHNKSGDFLSEIVNFNLQYLNVSSAFPVPSFTHITGIDAKSPSRPLGLNSWVKAWEMRREEGWRVWDEVWQDIGEGNAPEILP